jgi:hypothetical protein
MKSKIVNSLDILLKISSQILKKSIRKGIIAIAILLFILLIKAINTKPTNLLLGTIKNSIYYEFSIVEDSKRIFNKGKDLLDSSQSVLEVFNLGGIHKYSTPIEGTLHRKFHKDTNKGSISCMGEGL